MKIGRNEKCYCGSGKKYKHCCWLQPTLEELAQMQQSISEELDIDAEILKTKGIYINLVRPANFQGKRIWVLGNRLYPNEPPTITTFGDFILRALSQELGKQWWKKNEDKPPKEQHYIFRAYQQYVQWKKRTEKDALVGPDGSKGAYPDGWTYNLISLAFDVAMLIHRAGGLPEDILNRLRERDAYQGARYEVAVASIFARIGCEIKFINNHNNTEKHPEFYAQFPNSNLKVAVEAKSKHRQGIIHQAGQQNIANLQKTRGIVPLINDALKQNPGDMPFIIFVDINQPPDLSANPEEHLHRLVKATQKMKLPSLENPDEFSLIYLTNYSGQFLGENEMTKTFSTFIVPQFSKIPIRNQDFLDRLQKAVNGYGYIPHLTPEGIYLDDQPEQE